MWNCHTEAWKPFIPVEREHACVHTHTYIYIHVIINMEQRRVRTSAENVVQRETSSLSRTYYMRIKREREKGEDSRFVVMQDAKGDERCPPPQSSIPFSFPFQMASRRTSFPRLTASRHAEGNENNEIQRSSVTYARRAPPLNSHLYYLSGSKSIHPSPPLPSSAALRFARGVSGGCTCIRVLPQQRTNKGGKLISAMGLRSFTNAPLLISFKLGLAGIGFLNGFVSLPLLALLLFLSFFFLPRFLFIVFL